MSKRRQSGEQKSFKPRFLKEAWLLIENVNGGGDGRRFEVICVDPKVASKEGHQIGSFNWLYIQPDGVGEPRLVLTREFSRGREVMERMRRKFERDRTEWTSKNKEPERKTNKMTICPTSKHSIRQAKREMRRNAVKQEMKCMRKDAVNDFVLAKRRRNDRTRQFDGAVPSCSGVPRSRQVYTPPLPLSTPPSNSMAEEESYSSEVASASSSSTDEEEKFKRLVKSIAKYSGQFSKRSRSIHSSRCSSQRGYQHRRRLMMSTPKPTSSKNVKLTFDQATQTDPIENQQPDEEDSEVEEGRAALIQMGSLIQTITTQFNCLTQSMGLEGMNLDFSDMESEDEVEEEEEECEEGAEEELVEEEELDSEMHSESQSDQSSENQSDTASDNQSSEHPSLPPEEVAVPEDNEQQEIEVPAPEPVQRVSPVQAVAAPSVRVPTPQQHVAGPVERAEGEGQSSNESGEHFVTTSNIAAPGPSGKRMVKVRRVSAHTTNRLERAPGEDLVPIGNGRAMVPSRLLEEIDWNSYTQATRQLLQAVFPRRVLATHSLTGKRSPAFLDKPPKKRLDPQLVEDVVIVVTLRCGVTERLVRNCITIKCTDEAKLFRNRQQCRQGRLQGSDQENVPPNHATDEATETSSGDS